MAGEPNEEVPRVPKKRESAAGFRERSSGVSLRHAALGPGLKRPVEVARGRAAVVNAINSVAGINVFKVFQVKEREA